nr:AIM24 family protein [Nocardioides sp. TF02-7]
MRRRSRCRSRRSTPRWSGRRSVPQTAVLARRGAMLGYDGQVAFRPVSGLSQGVRGAVGAMLAGESNPLMAAEGNGNVLYGYRGLRVTVIDLAGDSLSVEADRLLAYDAALQTSVEVIAQGGIKAMARGALTGQGVATTRVFGHGSVVVLSHWRVLPAAAQRRDGRGRPAGLRRPHRRPPGRPQGQGRVPRRRRARLGRGVPAPRLRPRHGLRAGVRAEVLNNREDPTMQTFNADTLPVDDNVNDYAFSVALQGEWFLSKGAMIAYYGDVGFEAVNTYASQASWVAARFSSPIYVQDWVIAHGHGKVVVGDRGYNINSFDLDDGNLTIKAGNLLGFDPALELKQSIVPGFVTLIGTGKFLASSNGPVIFTKPPFRADPEALLGWADCPSPSHHYDAHWMTQSFLAGVQGLLGRESGEERQYDFTGEGDILLQSSEVVREDPAVMRLVESQTSLLSTGQKGILGRQLVAQSQQQ